MPGGRYRNRIFLEVLLASLLSLLALPIGLKSSKEWMGLGGVNSAEILKELLNFALSAKGEDDASPVFTW